MKRSQEKKYSQGPLIEPLESRMMMAADLPGMDLLLQADETQDLVADSQSILENALARFEQMEADTLSISVESLEVRPHEIVFINEDVPDHEGLIAAMQAEDDERILEIVILETDSDGLGQVSDVLSARHDIDAVHIIAHGSDGVFSLGGQWLDNEALLANSEILSSWSEGMSDDADILLYGCDIAIDEDGELLTDTLARLTGADVAASDDLTGHEELGGDWELEYQVGDIETDIIAPDALQTSWEHSLSVDNLTSSWSVAGPYTSTTTAATPVTVDMSFTTPPGSTVQNIVTDTLTTNAFFSDTYVQGSDSIYMEVLWDTTPEATNHLASDDAQTVTVTFTFDTAVVDPIIHIDRLGGVSGTLSNSSEWTVTTAGASLTKLAGVGHLNVTSDTFYRTPDETVTAESEASSDPSQGTAAGSIQVNGTYTSLTFDITGIGREGGGGDGVELAWELVADNQLPIISSDGGGATADLNIDENSTTVTTVTATDTDGDTPTFSISGGSDQGSFDIDSTTGVLTFACAPDFEAPTDSNTDGTYEVQVTADDGHDGTDTQTLSVTVNDLNEAPLFTSSEDTTATQDVLYSYSITTTDEDGDALSISAPTLPTWLTLTDNGDGSATLSGTPTNSEVGEHSVVLEVSDGSLSDTQSFTITVDNTNDAPEITSDGGGATAALDVAEGQTAVTTVTATDPDLDTPTFSISEGADSALFSIDPNTGVLTFATARDFETYTDANTDGVYEVQVTADDGNGGTDVQSISVTITDVDEVPTDIAPDSLSVDENTDTSGGHSLGTLSTTDEDSGESFTYTIVGGADAALFSIGGASSDELLLDDGILDFESQSSYEVTIRTTDSGGLWYEETLTVDVNDLNEAPLFTSSEDTTATQDVLYSYSITTTDEDGDALTISAPTLPTWLTLTDNGDGSATLSGTPTNSEVGEHSVVLEVSDGSLSDTQSFTIMVSNVNDAPVAVDDLVTTDEDTTFVSTSELDANDVDLDLDALHVVAGTFTTTQGGSITIASDGSYTYTPPADFTGMDSVEYTVSDGVLSDTATWTVTVLPVNDEPVAADDTVSTEQGVALDGIDVLHNVQDIDGDDLEVVMASAGHGIVVINEDSTLDYAPDSGYYGLDTITYVVSDGHGGSVTASLVVAVDPKSQTPEPDGYAPVQPETPEQSVSEEEEEEEEEVAVETPTGVIDTPTHSGEIVFDRPERVEMAPEPIDVKLLDDLLNIKEVPALEVDVTKVAGASIVQHVRSLERIDPADVTPELITEAVRYEGLHTDLDRMYKEIDESFEEQEHRSRLTSEVATGFEISLTAGFVAWMLRSGSLVASLFTVMPMWRNFDPVSILSESEALTDETAESDDKHVSSQQAQKAEGLFDLEKVEKV